MADRKPPGKTMRGWAIKSYGEPMQLMDVPVPREPGSRDVVIKMRGAEVGDWDELVRRGEWDMEREFPLVLGLAGLLGEHRRDRLWRRACAARADLGGGVILSQIHEFDDWHALFGLPRRLFAIGGHVT